MDDKPKNRWSYTRFVKRISDATNGSVVEGKYDPQLAARSYMDANELYVAAAALDAAIDQLINLLQAQTRTVEEMPGKAGQLSSGYHIIVETLNRLKAVDYEPAIAMVRKAACRYYTLRKGDRGESE
jgi:hypothetical protein